MDLSEDQFWKLVALGWDGKKTLKKFFMGKYGITATKEKLGLDMERINLCYTEEGKTKMNSIARRMRKRDPYLDALRLFRTVDGKIIGPSSICFDHQNKDWT